MGEVRWGFCRVWESAGTTGVCLAPTCDGQPEPRGVESGDGGK
jgi:hypothetical protein